MFIYTIKYWKHTYVKKAIQVGVPKTAQRKLSEQRWIIKDAQQIVDLRVAEKK